MHRPPLDGHSPRKRQFFLALLAAVATMQLTTAEEKIATVTVAPGQTLNEALKGVDGPVVVTLPVGTTLHDGPITLRKTLVIRGQGRELSTLQASADTALINQGDPMELFEGDLVIADLTYDRNHRHVGEAPAVVASSAAGDVIFKNFRVHHFNFDGKMTPFFLGAGPPAHRAEPDSPRHRQVAFRNAEVDFKAGGGIRSRPNNRAGFATIQFNADRFLFDTESVFNGHLTQHADPAQTVGDPPAGRGNAGGLGALGFNIWEYGLVDGTFRAVDYSVIRHGGIMSLDGVLEIRAFCPEAGFADQFWPRAYLPEPNGHLIYNGVVLISADGNPWYDRGFKANGDFRTITVRDCFISGPGFPIDFATDLRPGQTRQGIITITDTTILTRHGGIDLGNNDVELDGVFVNNLQVRTHPDSSSGFFTQAVHIREAPSGGGATHMVANVLADGYINDIVLASLGEGSILETSNLQGRRSDAITRVEGAKPLGTLPMARIAIDDSPASAAGLEPIATVEDFANAENFEKLDVYLTQHSTDGIYLMVVVSGDSISNTTTDMTNLWRSDAIQFAITDGLPGDSRGHVILDFALHDTEGPLVYRRNFWSDRDLSTGILDLEKTGIKLAVNLDSDANEITYKAFVPWEEIGLSAPPYEHLSIDLVATRGATYPEIKGSTWPSPYTSFTDSEDDKRAKSGGIFYAPTVPSRGFKGFASEIK